MAGGGNSPQYYRSRFGDTTLTKVFVGGLAWETPTEELRRYFEQFGDILEAVIITDKNTGRSKGYGFVTFRDSESARRSVADPNPLIDGRRANCNIAALGRPRPSPPRGPPRERSGRRTGRIAVTAARLVLPARFPAGPSGGSVNMGPPQAVGLPYGRLPAQMPAPMMYPTPYGYMTYATDYGYQQGMYNPHLASQYYQQQMIYGQSTQSTIGAPSYHYPHMGYVMQTSRGGLPASTFQSQPHRQSFGSHPMGQIEMEGSFFPQSSLPHGFQLQTPPLVRQSLATTDSQAPQTSLSTGGNNESSDD
ncbi:hypothetical protein HPP92_004283 [Vanilla planifolia]|uniref:RRM domain-containing protein n=1 Tax=Vanilla planifolia TaxID=51239 RepID=A0A835S9V5_VANPL|nr:hypothetical protein HPP92_004283 [Vanilla planifolia]